LRHVPAAALDAQDLDVLAGDVGDRRLDRRVAAAVQHQGGLAAEQPRGIDAERQILVHALLGVALDIAAGVGVAPLVLHRVLPTLTTPWRRAHARQRRRACAGLPDRAPRAP